MVDIRDHVGTGQGMDLGDMVTAVCPCGGNLFKAIVSFDEDTYEISMYHTDGECLQCNSRFKLPTPLDKE